MLLGRSKVVVVTDAVAIVDLKVILCDFFSHGDGRLVVVEALEGAFHLHDVPFIVPDQVHSVYIVALGPETDPDGIPCFRFRRDAEALGPVAE